MFKYFFSYLKIIFYIANIILITLYVFPGSILGWFIYGNVGLQPQITSDFIVSLIIFSILDKSSLSGSSVLTI